jgi:CRISPR-associated protein Cmr1
MSIDPEFSGMWGRRETMLKKIIFEIETITPMFLAGANQSKAELRAASIKGLLRFWWRALQAEADINKLIEKESQIFGTSNEKIGSSSFSLRISNIGDLKTTKDKFLNKPNYQVPVEGKSFKINILEYLAYGTYEYVRGKGNIFNRERIDIGSKFNVLLTFKEPLFKEEVLLSLYVLSLFGGVGSKSRNGFGLFNILNKEKVFEELKDVLSIDKPYERENLLKLIKNKDTVDYSSFTQNTKVFRARNTYDNSLDCLAEIGKIYRHCKLALESRHTYKKRQYIGAPLDPPNENFRSFLDRHAKPYFLKVAKEGNKYRGYILYLPSKYCSGVKENRNKQLIDHNIVDKMFNSICIEFNELLSKNMAVIL